MAMAQCKECKKDVSSKAEVCPHCGYRIRNSKGFRAFRALFMMVIGLVMIVAAAAIVAQGG